MLQILLLAEDFCTDLRTFQFDFQCWQAKKRCRFSMCFPTRDQPISLSILKFLLDQLSMEYEI